MQSVRIRLDGYEASPACCSASLACIRPHAPSPMCIPQSSNAMMRRRDPRHALPPQRMPPLLGEAPRASSPRCMTPLLVGCSVARTSRTRHMCERASCPGMRDMTPTAVAMELHTLHREAAHLCLVLLARAPGRPSTRLCSNGGWFRAWCIMLF